MLPDGARDLHPRLARMRPLRVRQSLIMFRALQGVGAALLMPGTLSILTVTFPPEERSRAIGIWAGVSGLALALGPTLGGWIVERSGWETVFFINVPIGVVAFAIAWRTVRESVSEETRHLDLPGLALGTERLLALTFALIEANQRGWGGRRSFGALVTAGVLLVAFLVWERRTPNAMMPLTFFRIPTFSAGNAVTFSRFPRDVLRLLPVRDAVHAGRSGATRRSRPASGSSR